MTIEAGLAFSRFVHFAALTFLFGLSLFPLYSFAAAAPPLFRNRARVWMTSAAALALISALAWAAFTAAAMQDDIAGAVDSATLSAMISETTFGPIWLARLGVLLLLAIAAFTRSAGGAAERALAALALASLALTGHTQMQEGAAQILHVASDILHLLAAGTWLGGIAGLLLLLHAARDGSEDSERLAARALERFSPVGYAVVATLIATGVVNSLFTVGSLAALIETTYGRLLLAKILLFALMLGLAASNRLSLVPKLADDAKRRTILSTFKRQIAFEQVVGLFVLAVVAVLGTSEPPV